MKYQKGNVKRQCLLQSYKKKYLGINLTNKVKDLYDKNYKTSMKEIEMIQRNGKISHALGLEELMLLKCPYYPKQSTDLT